MVSRRWYPRAVTVLLLVLTLTLGSLFVARQPRITRLEAAFAHYQRQYSKGLEHLLDLDIVLGPADSRPLDDLVELIKKRFKERGYPRPIIIVVDPVGVAQANQSLTAPVRIPPPGGRLPLREHLRQAFEPMGLATTIKDGAIVISSQTMIDEMRALDD